MGKYKGKYLKGNVGAVPPDMQGDADLQYGDESLPKEEPNTAETIVDTLASPIDIAPRPKKKSKWFAISLILYTVILLAVSGFLQVTLWQYLKSSQAEMDQQAAELAAQQAHEKAVHQAPQLAFESWQSGLTADYWTDLWYAQAPSDLDVREAVQAVMAERFAPEDLEAFKATEFTDETPVYVLKNGEDSLARVTLTGNELDWSVSEVELLLEGTHSASVTVADGYQVRCNGKEMGAEYTEAAESCFRYEPLEDQLEGAVTWVNYHVEGLLMEPELIVEPPEGYGAIQTEEGEYLLGMEEDTSEYEDKAVKFVRSYLYYYMSGSKNTQYNMSNVLKHLTSGTQAYQDIRETYVGVVWATVYTGINTTKTTAGNVLYWADNCFSVDVTYDADCTLRGKHVDYADATMRIYFLRTDKGFVISNFETL